jgi:hypothetical protein
MKTLGWLLVAGGLSLGGYLMMSGLPESQTIVVPAAPEDEKAAIETLVKDYYGALRNRDFTRAAACYEPGALDALGMAPEKVLEQAVKLMPVPKETKLEGLRVDGTRATGEIVIDREGVGPVSYVMSSEGKQLGTWAKTLHFTKTSAGWRIAADSGQTIDGMDEQSQAALELLKKLQEKK